jgi:hypothetical protein
MLGFVLLILFIALMAWLGRGQRPRPRRAPFQPRGKGGPPSAHLRAIAWQRKIERLSHPTPAELRFNQLLQVVGFVEGRDYEREAIYFYPSSFCLFDVYFPRLGLVFELDGKIHAEAGQAVHDQGRDAYCAAQGLRICRIPNRIVLRRPRWCRAMILAATNFPARQTGTFFPTRTHSVLHRQ